MPEDASNPSASSSSSSRRGNQLPELLDELDGDEAADLSLDNALLADDPLEGSNQHASSVLRH